MIKRDLSSEKDLPFVAIEQYISSIGKPGNKGVYINVEGKRLYFENNHEYVRRYRTPLGYAAQGLQIVAVPIDICFSVIAGVGLGIHGVASWGSSLFEDPNQ